MAQNAAIKNAASGARPQWFESLTHSLLCNLRQVTPTVWAMSPHLKTVPPSYTGCKG